MRDHVDDFYLWIYVVVEDMCQEQEASRELRPAGLIEVAPSIPSLPGQASHPLKLHILQAKMTDGPGAG